jgi:hypothetical protein
MAGYLTYIATMITAGREGVVSTIDIAKNIVPLLNKAAVTAPALGPPEVRKALRTLLMEKCKVDEKTMLFKAGGSTFQRSVSKLLTR